MYAQRVTPFTLARTKVNWSRETVRQELRAQGYVWKRAKLKAKNDDPLRAQRLAKIRTVIESLRADEAFFWADELDLNLLFRQLLTELTNRCGARIKRIYVVADNYKIHKAKAVEQWLAAHPRVEILWLPSYCPQANPIERAFGDIHDKCTRNHTRKALHWLIWDVKQHLLKNGPWKYKVPSIYYEAEVEAELTKSGFASSLKLAA